MNTDSENPTSTPASDVPPAESAQQKYPNLKRWKPGQSGNPGGRPKREPRVRRYARRFSRRMIKVLVELAEDKKVAPSERRKAAMDVISYDAGKPVLVQEVTGRDGQPVGPLVALNFSGQQPGGQMSAAQAYQYMVNGLLPADPDHEAFRTIEAPSTGGAP